MMSLRSWYFRKLVFPLAVLASLIFIGILLALTHEASVRRAETSNLISKSISLLNLAFDQKNNALIEVTLLSLMQQVKSKGIAICDGNQEYLGVGVANLCLRSSTNVFESIESFPVHASIGKEIVIRSNYFETYRDVLLFISLAVVFLSFIVVISWYTLNKFSREILSPMTLGISSDSKMAISEFEEIRKQNLRFHEHQKNQAVLEAIVEKNAQVAHDIKSPLTALNMIARIGLSSSQNLEPLLNKAVTRITEIANDLKTQNTALITGNGEGKELSQFVRFNLSNSLSDLINEKKFEFLDVPNVKIDFECDLGDAEVSGPQIEFTRVVSNIINNAKEALENQNRGAIMVDARLKNHFAEITFLDNGVGFPDQIVASVGQRGLTFNKTEGTGLGIYHAFKIVKSMGGQLQLGNRKDSKGAFVRIQLPLN